MKTTSQIGTTTCLRIAIVPVAIAVLLATTTGVAAANDSRSARDVIDRHLDAIGGREAVLKRQSIHYHGPFEVQGVSGSFDLYLDQGRVLFSVELPGLGTLSEGYDGKTGWEMAQAGPKLLDGEALEQLALQAQRENELRLDQHYRSIERDGSADLDGVSLQRVRFVHHSGNEIVELYDPASGLRRASISTQETPVGDQEVTLIYDNYRDFEGLKLATKIVQRVAGQEIVRTAETVSFEPIDDAVFDLPSEIEALVGGGLSPSYSNFVELRVYRTKTDKRDRFLEFFEEHYLESQEVLGMRIWGQFRDLTTPTHFVWVRGYRNMEERGEGLEVFYNSPLWQETGPEVGQMLASAQHVHFLEPLGESDRFSDDFRRPTLRSEEPGNRRPGVVAALLFRVMDEQSAEVAEAVRDTVMPKWEKEGAVSLGLFGSSREENNYPILRFIEDEEVIAWFASFESRSAFEAASAAVSSTLTPFETFVLEPGARSRLSHRAP